MIRTWSRLDRGGGRYCSEHNVRQWPPSTKPSTRLGGGKGAGSHLTRGPPKEDLPQPSFKYGGGGPLDPPPLLTPHQGPVPLTRTSPEPVRSSYAKDYSPPGRACLRRRMH